MFQIANKGDIKRNKNGSPQNEGTNFFNKLKKNYYYYYRRFRKTSSKWSKYNQEKLSTHLQKVCQ